MTMSELALWALGAGGVRGFAPFCAVFLRTVPGDLAFPSREIALPVVC